MIKRIIFDIDNTLIDWKNEYDEKIIRKCYEKENIIPTERLMKKTIKAFNTYDKKYWFQTFGNKTLAEVLQQRSTYGRNAKMYGV